MKILMINTVCGIRSTGRICTELADELESQGHEVKIAYGRENVPEQYQKYAVKIGSNWDVKLHGLHTRFFDNHAFCSNKATRQFLDWAESYKPDLLWLHNLHGYYINVEILFIWIKQHPKIRVKWTLHDCWAFTGHCAHFTLAHCEQWKSQCSSCSQKHKYPSCYGFFNVRRTFERKKKVFTCLENMTLIVPSQWLATLVKQSFLNKYPIEVVYNKIDTNIFKPTPSNFREQHNLKGKIIILGVASAWSREKGLYDFYELSKMLNNHYAIVLVGLTDKQIKNLPKTIYGFKCTNSPQELAAIYTAADVLVSASKEESFGLTPIEAQACGTPSIVYQNTACEEIAIANGNVVVAPNVHAIYEAIINMKFK